MSSNRSVERTLLIASAVNGGLGTAGGALAGGLMGAKIGLLAGLFLAVLPIVVPAVASWLGRPDGLPRFIASEIGKLALAGGRAVVSAIGTILRPIGHALAIPILLVRIVGDVSSRAVAMVLAACWRLVATPLGLANLAALAVLAIDASGFDFAGPVTILGLGMLILVLLVSANEEQDERAARGLGRQP